MLNISLNHIKQKFFKRSKQLPSEEHPGVIKESYSLFNYPELLESGFPESQPENNPFKSQYMKRFRFIPISETSSFVFVAMADPLDFNSREIIERVYNKRIKIYRATEELIYQFIYRWHEAEADMTSGGKALDTDIGIEEQLWESPEHLKDMASEAPVIRLVNHLITKAIEAGASDIHIEPRKKHVQIRYRIDGVLNDQNAIAVKLKAAINSRVKLMAKMDIAETRLPKDGRIKFKNGNEEIDIRVSSIPTHFGESLVLRLLHKESVELDMNTLGFPDGIKDKFKAIISLPYGMVLVTGPTGSGKTTTLYSALNTINSPDKKIVTVEDPIEYQMDGVNQVQVQPNIGLTFAHCLRTFLRQDPDVMLVGEIRDQETAEIAIQAALTGHVVFSTLHTNDASGAITRLEDMGVERFLIASSVVAVLAQRLVRRVCRQCMKEFKLKDEDRMILALGLGLLPDEIPPTHTKGTGCKECSYSGYKGRVGIYEFLLVDEAIQREIVKGSDRNEIFKIAIQRGMTSLRMDGIDKVKNSITTYEEVMRVTR